MHKQHSRERGIEFEFDFETWTAWWGDDFENRGTHEGQLVMARRNDEGPYHPDNVYKLETTDNVREHHALSKQKQGKTH